ncbi:IclR family transcriptional regulator [Aquihabitans sp. McL0605]|uniref:IclR family transcriptional regulator n=1 Tax=Aquihabitans sp. McL0605 TaxID=3415671 RepID=UPI003CF4B685
MEQTISGVGVLDKSVAVLDAVAIADGPCTLADLVAATGLPKATAHRLAVALEVHGLLRRDQDGRFLLGVRLIGLGRAAADDWPLAEAARPALEALRDLTGESVQLYRRDGEHRVCVVSLESPHELRTIVPQGARLPLGLGSAGRILSGEAGAARWTDSVGERAPGVASVSAPVVVAGELVAAVGISGPLGRLGDHPGARHGEAVAAAAAEIAAAVGPR